MSHLLSCSAHLKSAADVKARCLAVDASEAEANPHQRCMRKRGPSTALGIFHACGTHRRGSAQLVSAETGVWEAAPLCSSLAVSSEGFSHWSSLPEAAPPLLSLPSSDQLSQSYKSSSFLLVIKCSRLDITLAAAVGLLPSLTDELWIRSHS